MKKEYIDALTYLSSFDNGLSHYNWDRAMTYKLKYGIHPGKFIQSFKADGLLESETSRSSTNYKLNAIGKIKVDEHKRDLELFNELVIKSFENLKNKDWNFELDARTPFYQLRFGGSEFKIWIKRTLDEDKVICYFPSETEAGINEFSFSRIMLEKTDILCDLLEAHFKYLFVINSELNV